MMTGSSWSALATSGCRIGLAPGPRDGNRLLELGALRLARGIGGLEVLLRVAQHLHGTLLRQLAQVVGVLGQDDDAARIHLGKAAGDEDPPGRAIVLVGGDQAG